MNGCLVVVPSMCIADLAEFAGPRTVFCGYRRFGLKACKASVRISARFCDIAGVPLRSVGGNISSTTVSGA